MTRIILVTLLFCAIQAYGQEIPLLKPTRTSKLDFGPQKQKEWQIRNEALAAISKGDLEWDEMSEEQEKYVTKYGEIYKNIWDIIGNGCSWYCGGSIKSISASSSLDPSSQNSYSPSNAHDLSYQTAWVEGVKGHGIRETIEYIFSAPTPRVTEIIIVNGYVKSDNIWRANSRVKKLKLFYNNKPFAILDLEDDISEQHFKFEVPFGYSNRSNLDALKNEPDWSLKFEILDVYEGDKYQDTCITEIFFNGIDVH